MSEKAPITLMPGGEVPLSPALRAAKPFVLSAMRSMAQWGIGQGILKESTLYLEEQASETDLIVNATEFNTPLFYESQLLCVSLRGEYSLANHQKAIGAVHVRLSAPDGFHPHPIEVFLGTTRPLTSHVADLSLSFIRFYLTDGIQEIDYFRHLNGVGSLSYRRAPDFIEQTANISAGGIVVGLWPEDMPQDMRTLVARLDKPMAIALMKGLIAAVNPVPLSVEEHNARLENLLRRVVSI